MTDFLEELSKYDPTVPPDPDPDPDPDSDSDSNKGEVVRQLIDEVSPIRLSETLKAVGKLNSSKGG